MQKITIQVDLTDAQAANFVGRDVIVTIPAMRAEYLAFLDHATRLHDGFAMFGAALAKMRELSDRGELAEGLNRLSDLTEAMRSSELALQAFFRPATPTMIATARTGEVLH